MNNVNGRQDDLASDMVVPERIIVIGGDKMASTREILPEAGFENHLLGDNRINPIDLPSPPSVLTYEAYSQPNDDFRWRNEVTPRPNRVKIAPMAMNGDDYTPVKDDYTPTRDSRMMSSFESNSTPADAVSALRQQIRSLNRRISAIERENRQKDQRDMIIYSVGLVYIAIKTLMYIKRNIL